MDGDDCDDGDGVNDYEDDDCDDGDDYEDGDNKGNHLVKTGAVTACTGCPKKSSNRKKT